MKILKSIEDLHQYLKNNDLGPGCFADTGFLYGLTYDDDRLFDSANDVHDLLSRFKISIYTNVISRLELIDLVFRKQVTQGCISTFNSHSIINFHSEIYKLLKDIRDKYSTALRKKTSYKIDERRLKQIRKNINHEYGFYDWKDFCRTYLDSTFINEWVVIEDEFGLNFIESMEGETSPLLNSPLLWKDMVHIMATEGQRGSDAMIINLFKKSKFPLLITSDSDLENSFGEDSYPLQDKAIFIL